MLGESTPQNTRYLAATTQLQLKVKVVGVSRRSRLCCTTMKSCGISIRRGIADKGSLKRLATQPAPGTLFQPAITRAFLPPSCRPNPSAPYPCVPPWASLELELRRNVRTAVCLRGFSASLLNRPSPSAPPSIPSPLPYSSLSLWSPMTLRTDWGPLLITGRGFSAHCESQEEGMAAVGKRRCKS